LSASFIFFCGLRAGTFRVALLGPALQPWLPNGPLKPRWIDGLTFWRRCVFLERKSIRSASLGISGSDCAAVLGLWALANGFGWFTVVRSSFRRVALCGGGSGVLAESRRRRAGRSYAGGFLCSVGALRIALFVVFRNSRKIYR